MNRQSGRRRWLKIGLTCASILVGLEFLYHAIFVTLRGLMDIPPESPEDAVLGFGVFGICGILELTAGGISVAVSIYVLKVTRGFRRALRGPGKTVAALTWAGQALFLFLSHCPLILLAMVAGCHSR